MRSFFPLLLERLGYTGDPESLCASGLQPWLLLFITGSLAVLALGIAMRCLVDLIHPPTVTQRVAGSRSVVHWSLTATAIVLMSAVIEAVGPTQRLAATDWLRELSSTSHPLSATGFVATLAGIILFARAMALLQVDMFRRVSSPNGPRGLPSDGGFVQSSGFALRGFKDNRMGRNAGGGLLVAILGLILGAYGVVLLRQVDLCL